MNEDLNWKTWMKRGNQYLKPEKPVTTESRLGTEIRYNLISMAFENYIMAILDCYGTMPDNHTYTDLFDGLDTVLTIDPELKKRILKYENIQSICSIEKYHTRKPTEEEITDLRGAVMEIYKLATTICAEKEMQTVE